MPFFNKPLIKIDRQGAPAPLYLKIKQMIVEQIQSKAWLPHFRIPSESELAEKLSVSRMTINRALRELTAEGYLVRLQGVGSFVAEPKGQAALFEIQNIADEISARGHQHRARVVVMEQIKAASPQVESLEVKKGAPIFHSVLVHFENNTPVQIEERYVNAALVPDYLQQDFTTQTPNKYLNAVIPATEGEHIVEAVLANQDECALLDIKPDQPCLLIYRRTWTTHFIVSSARLLYPGARYRLTGKFGL